MSEKSLKHLLKSKASEFMRNKHNAEALRMIIDSFKVSIVRRKLNISCNLVVITFSVIILGSKK